jgi:hypothetical protein
MSRNRGLWLTTILASFLLAQGAWATAFTLDSALVVTDGTNSVTINPVSNTAGTTTCAGGPCDLSGDILLFSVTVNSGVIDEIGASFLAFAFLSDAGAFNDPDATPSGISTVGGTQGIWDFDAPNMNPGDTSDRLFITYAAGTLSTSFGASFMVQPSGGLIFSNSGGLVALPAPGTIALLAGSLVGLAISRRRR